MTRNNTRLDWLVKALSEHHSDECLIWPFKRDDDNYGRLRPAKEEGIRITVGAHRLAFKLTHGRWPMPCCLHSCDTPPCVNPRHLSEGTCKENQADKVAKGRHLFGTLQHSAVLTDTEVTAAREEYKKGKVGFGTLSKKYRISRLAMRLAIEGKTWSHVPGAVPALRLGSIKKDFCKRGHFLTDENCYMYGNFRQCKICTNIRYTNSKLNVPHNMELSQ